jgi:hypothetical protein
MENSKHEMLQFVQSLVQFTDEQTFLLKLSIFWKIFVWFSVTLSLLVGWVAKSVIYHHILKNNIKEQPINILILIEQLVHHFCGNFILINIIFSFPLRLSIAEMIDKYFGNLISGNMSCWVYFYIQNLNITYRGIAGLEIAFIRFLYIKKGTWVKHKFGEWSLFLIVGIKMWAVSCTMIYFFGSENVSNRSIYNICMGHSQAFEVIKIFSSIKSRNNIKIKFLSTLFLGYFRIKYLFNIKIKILT